MPVDPYHPAGTDDLPEIKTGNGVDRDLAATTNDRLKKNVWEMRILNSTMSEVVSQLKTNNKSEQETILELRDLNAILSAVLEQQKETTIASEKTTTALDNLTSTIKKLDKKNGRLQWMIIALTVATVGLAYVQVWVAFHPPQTPQPQIIVKEVPVKTKYFNKILEKRVYNISTMNLKEFAVTCALCGLVVNYLPYHMTANHSSSSTTTYTSSYPQSTEPDPPGTLYPTIPPLDNTGSVQGTVTSTTTTL